MGHPGEGGVRSRWKGVLGNLALLTGSMAVALLLGEVLIRVFAPQQLVSLRPDIWQPVDSVGWRFRPRVNTTYSTGERWVHIVTDTNGYRTARGGRPEGSSRVL